MAAAMFAMLTINTQAYALDQEVQITIDGSTTIFHAGNGLSASGSVTHDGVTVIASSVSDSPGGGSNSYLLGSTLQLLSTGGSHTIVISVGDTNFTSPTTPPDVFANSHLGGTTSTADPSSTLSFQSYIDTANGQNSTSGGLGTQTGYDSGNINAAGSFALTDATKTFTSLSSGFSMTSVATITLKNAANLNYTTSLDLNQVPVNSVPEPSSMALAGLGALGMIGYGLRRRKAVGV
jgi:hypothetical protein